MTIDPAPLIAGTIIYIGAFITITAINIRDEHKAQRELQLRYAQKKEPWTPETL